MSETLAQINAALAKIRLDLEHLDQRRQEVVERKIEFLRAATKTKVGDIVLLKSSFAHRGKKAIIDSFYLHEGVEREDKLHANVTVLKNCGQKGLRQTVALEWEKVK